jgi:hypothetical protein
MTPKERAIAREWCRAFIDHGCILRSPPGQKFLPTQDAILSNYQYFFPIATLDPGFQARIAALFWDHYLPKFRARPFQLCGCESGGVPLVCTLQAYAYRMGLRVNVFTSKKAQKTYGLRNWLEGMVSETLPVVMVDDVVGAKLTLTAHGKRLSGMGLEIVEAWAIAACSPKHQPPFTVTIAPGRSIPLTVLLGVGDFADFHERYVARYGRAPQFKGVMR